MNKYDKKISDAMDTLDKIFKQDPRIVKAMNILEKASKREENIDIGLPTPAEAIRFRMEQSGHTQTELAELLGSRSHASELLSGKRYPSKRDALIIYREWGVPLICLIQEKGSK